MNVPHGIIYSRDEQLQWVRKPYGKGFRYLNHQHQSLSTTEVERIKKLAIPPAWQTVRINPNPRGHLQAVGIDARGRRQYLYHPNWIEYNQRHKFDSLPKFGTLLPVLRQTVAGHMRQHTLTRQRVLATIVWLLENTFIRVGNKTYAKENHSYGLTTLRNKHVEVEGNTVTFSFKGKSSVYHELDVKHPRVVKTIKACIELPGYELFQYLDETGERRTVDSSDVNSYLQEIVGESVTAKDFRTWGGTTLAGNTLYTLSTNEEPLPKEKAIIETIKEVASHLGNTTAVCRKYYIHPSIFQSFEKGRLVKQFESIATNPVEVPEGLSWEEYAVLHVL